MGSPYCYPPLSVLLVTWLRGHNVASPRAKDQEARTKDHRPRPMPNGHGLPRPFKSNNIIFDMVLQHVSRLAFF